MRTWIKGTTCGIAVAAMSVFAGVSPCWAQSDTMSVLQYMEMNAASGLVMLSAGSTSGLVVGDVLIASRPAAGSPLAVDTGKIKVVKVEADRAIGSVIIDGTDISRAAFSRFSGVMAGDRVVFDRPVLAHNPRLTPEITVGYQQLFLDPGRDATSYELTEDGMTALREQAVVFAEARLSMLLVKGYTDPTGSSEQNQIESYQRAMAVREFLIRDLGFDRDRVVAIGMGETESVSDGVTPDFAESNRRVILKAVPIRDME